MFQYFQFIVIYTVHLQLLPELKDTLLRFLINHKLTFDLLFVTIVLD